MFTNFDNLPNELLADEIGRVDAIVKAAEAELKALKDEFKRRGLTSVRGELAEVTATEQLSGRLDTKRIREFLGDSAARFETPVISTVIRIKPVLAGLDALMAA